MTTPADDFVVQLARERGLVSDEQLATAQAAVAAHMDLTAPVPKLIDRLEADGVLDGPRIARLLAEEFDMPFVSLDGAGISGEVLSLVPRAFAMRHRLMPLKLDGGMLQVAISDPLETDGIDSLTHMMNHAVEAVVAPADEIARAIERFYGKDENSLDGLLDRLAPAGAQDAAVPVGADRRAARGASAEEADAPIVRLVHSIILDAIGRRASDIHLEPLDKRFRVRYRIDGVLLEVENPPKRLQLAIISRLKIMANLSIAEKRLPQDGRIQITLGARSLDLRVSSLPTAHGESIVMRILDKAGLQLGLPELGFFSDDQAMFERLIALPDGILLVTGPTGSGKTTTLYSCLHHINQPDRKIITVEDPVEYQLAGVNQVPVREEVGMTFAAALRSMLRQAPNVVMIGEIRDLETAEIAINASLTGHMVFSTLHTNDAPGAVTRLIDLGVKPFLVATSLRAVMAQRLVRRNCAQCSRPCEPGPQELRALNLTRTQAAGARLMRGAGCPACNGTGYRGRMGIFELFAVNEELQQMIYRGASAARLRDKARSLGMRTMREDGARKVIAGLTTVEEVVSITIGDAS
ncbi:MAG TPA: ATPase, T2SS/T4P/T4SS family [Opitutus sp.]|nr:ATPase, T2SS/T4P/T4SS family [Opitutus sp.]